MKKRVLIVTEDPAFAHAVRELVGPTGSVVTCLGPAQQRCMLDERGSCPLAAGSELALVDSPGSGDFFDHYRGIPSVTYAERLAEAHPGTEVLLCKAADLNNQPSAFLTRLGAFQRIQQAFASETRGDVDES